MGEVVCLGQFTADVVVTPVAALPEQGKAIFVDDISLTNGGCACNTAVALGRLGVATSVIGKVGCDTFGDFLIGVMDRAGLDTHAMVRDPSVHTSATAVLIDPEGERSFLHFSGGNARLSEDEIDYETIRRAKVLHVAAAFLVPGLDGEPMARVLSKAREMGVTTSLDTAWDARGRWMELLRPCLAEVDVFMPSIEESRALSGKEHPAQIAELFLDYGIRAVVIKLGADGCYARTAEAEYYVPAFKVEKIVDTLGAGDSFAAGFLAATVKGWPLPRACRFANAVGACCVGDKGTAGIRPFEDVMKLYPMAD
jgi:sugar/nucleoside kinase (ribokinase family)